MIFVDNFWKSFDNAVRSQAYIQFWWTTYGSELLYQQLFQKLLD